MKLLVTGGAGYIGSVVTEALLAAGHQVEVLDDLSTGHRDAVLEGATFHVGDLAEAGRLLDSSFDAVVHLAAKSLVGESVAHPQRYWHGNIVATMGLLDAMRTAGVTRMVFSSTAAVYGEPGSDPITEQTPTAPTNPYGASKLAIDHMLTAEAAAHGMEAVSLRYFNVAGASGSLRERHDPETHLIPNLLQVAHDQSGKASIFGTDYPTRDGTAIRDYIHVTDLARAHLLALESTQPGASRGWGEPGSPQGSAQPGESAQLGAPTRSEESAQPDRHQIFNLGTGTGTTVREVVAAVREVTGVPIEAAEKPRRPGDPPVLVASGERAASELGWRPQRDVRQMVADAWAARQPAR